MKRVLIVDDQPDVRTIYSRLFDKYGYHVDIAENGIEALSLINEVMPDLVVLDMNMPKLSGIEVLRSIRANPNLRPIKVIMVTGNYLVNQLPDIDYADLVLIKPVSIFELIKMAQRLSV